MRFTLTLIFVASASAAALDFPAPPKTAKVEAVSCDVYARDAATESPKQSGEERHTVLNGTRKTWAEDDVTFTLTKVERVNSRGEKNNVQTKMRRQRSADGDLTRERIDEITTTSTDDAESTTVTSQQDLVMIAGDRRTLVSRTVDGKAIDDVNEIVTTTEGPTERTIETLRTGPTSVKITDVGDARVVLVIRSKCTFTTPTS